MKRDFLPGNQFPLPENWEPEGTICATFVIPDDPEYLAAITGLVDELKWSKSFARDDTGTGAATVSRTWQRALESQPVFTQGCDMPEFRMGENCLLEVNCGSEDEPNWQPVFTSPHPGQEPEIPYPPDTPEYEDDTARCIAAANIAAQLKYGTETLANDASIVGGIAVAIIGLLGAFLFFVPGGVLVDIALAIITYAVGHTAEEFSDDLPEIDWESVRDALACFIERDGSVNEEDKAAFLEWMEEQYVGNLAWGLAKIIVQNVSADGLTNDARMHQNEIDIEGCVDCDGWEHVWNAENGWDGWSGYTGRGAFSPAPAAVLVDGEWTAVTDGSYRELTIICEDAGFDVQFTDIRVNYFIENNASGYAAVWKADGGAEVSEWFTMSHFEGANENGAEVGGTAQQMTIVFQIGGAVGELKITEVRLTGIGADPFA